MLLRPHARRLSGFIEPCLPRPADKPPSGPGWLHEIKHDGFRIVATRERGKVRLLSRRGNEFTDRFPAAIAAIAALEARSFVIDGEAIAVDENGLAVFELLRVRSHDHVVLLCAFDLVELDGADLRPQPLEARKTALARLLRGVPRALRSMSTMRPTAQSSTGRLARSAVRASCRSAWDPCTGPAGRTAGSRSRTLPRRRSRARPRRSGTKPMSRTAGRYERARMDDDSEWIVDSGRSR
jgi:ATP-dependent DNA ligase